MLFPYTSESNELSPKLHQFPRIREANNENLKVCKFIYTLFEIFVFGERDESSSPEFGITVFKSFLDCYEISFWSRGSHKAKRTIFHGIKINIRGRSCCLEELDCGNSNCKKRENIAGTSN